MSQDRYYHRIVTDELVRIEGRTDTTMKVVGPWSNPRDRTLHIPGNGVNERDNRGNLVGWGVKGRQARSGSELVVYTSPMDVLAERARRGIVTRRQAR